MVVKCNTLTATNIYGGLYGTAINSASYKRALLYSDILPLGIFKADWKLNSSGTGGQLKPDDQVRWQSTPKGAPIVILWEGQWVFYGIKDTPITTLFALFSYDNNLMGLGNRLIVGDWRDIQVDDSGTITAKLSNVSNKGYLTLRNPIAARDYRNLSINTSTKTDTDKISLSIGTWDILKIHFLYSKTISNGQATTTARIGNFSVGLETGASNISGRNQVDIELYKQDYYVVIRTLKYSSQDRNIETTENIYNSSYFINLNSISLTLSAPSGTSVSCNARVDVLAEVYSAN